jgi:DNA-binding transcriptional LysR family regulator
MLCVGDAYPLNRSVVAVHQVLKHPWVIFEYSSDMNTETLLKPYGKPDVFMRTNNPELFRKLIRDGSAVGMVAERTSRSKQFAADKIRCIPLREKSDDLGFCLHVILSARHCPSPAAELFIQDFIDNMPKIGNVRVQDLSAIAYQPRPTP